MGYGNLPLGESLDAVLAPLRDAWSAHVESIPLPWYAEEKARSGAFSSLVGVTLYANQDAEAGRGRWEALALGDSCLFQARSGRLVAALPLDTPEQFNSRPFLLPSVLSSSEPEIVFSHFQGEWQADDVFFLMTDALAHWFLHTLKEDAALCSPLYDLNSASEPSFAERVAQLRSDHQMRNDDVTLLRINVY
jgi:hypothetical protein